MQEVVRIGDEVDVEELPICTYHEKDAGKYITAGLAVMRDPETGINNVGIYRHMVHEKNLLGVQLSETADGNIIWKKYEKRGLPVPGRDRDRPSSGILHRLAVLLDARFRRDSRSPAECCSGRCRWCGARPFRSMCRPMPRSCWNAKFARSSGGPKRRSASIPGTYGPQRMNPVLEIKAITQAARSALPERLRRPRRQPAAVGLDPHELHRGYREDRLPDRARRQRCRASGRYRFICYVAIEKMHEGEAKLAAMAAFVADPFLKFVVVVDHDVDINNDTDVLHAIATRVRADHDIFMVPYAKGSPLDPASYDPAGGSNLVTKMGIDATRKAITRTRSRCPASSRSTWPTSSRATADHSSSLPAHGGRHPRA